MNRDNIKMSWALRVRSNKVSLCIESDDGVHQLITGDCKDPWEAMTVAVKQCFLAWAAAEKRAAAAERENDT